MAAEDVEKKRKDAQAKLKELMTGRQTHLSEAAKPAAPSSFARYRCDHRGKNKYNIPVIRSRISPQSNVIFFHYH